jgi:hypothetical protein
VSSRPPVPCRFRQGHASCVTWSFWKPRLRSAPHSIHSANPKAARLFTSARDSLHSHTRLTQRPRTPAAAIYTETGDRVTQARLIRQPRALFSLRCQQSYPDVTSCHIPPLCLAQTERSHRFPAHHHQHDALRRVQVAEFQYEVLRRKLSSCC